MTAPVQFLLRIPAGLRKRIAAQAKENGRSINAEIIDRLERSEDNESRLTKLEKAVEALQATINTTKGIR